MKVLKNFSCNGVKKKSGESLDVKEQGLIGPKFLKELLSNDLLANTGNPAPAKKEVKKEEPKKAKKLKENKKEA